MDSIQFQRLGRPPGFLSAPEAAAQLGVCRQIVTLWCRKNPGLGVRHLDQWWLDPRKLRVFLDARAAGAPRTVGGDFAGAA